MTQHQTAPSTAGTVATEPVVVHSAWPWRGSEIRTIALTPVVGLAVALVGQGWWWVAAAAGLGASAWLYRVGSSRKARSLVTATITPDRITLRSSSLMGSSTVALDAVDEIAYRELGSDRVLLLVGGGSAARLPERLLDQEPVRDVVEHILQRGPRVSTEAQALLSNLGLA